ncbi:MAG: hypothetical protein R3D30_03395 [Hyphomicrobiales bacterium]
MSDVIPGVGSLKLLVIRDLKQAGICTSKMLRLIQPIIYLVLALSTILYLEPVLSTALIAFSLVMLPIFYLLSRRIQKNASNFFGRQKAEGSHAVSILTARLQGANAGQGSRVRNDWLDSHPAYEAFLDAYDNHKLAADYMALRASLLRSIFVVSGLAAFGWLAIEGQRSWSVLVIYVGALIFFAAGLQRFLTLLTGLIKFYPQTRRAVAVIDRLNAAEASAPLVAEPPPNVSLSATRRLEGSERRRVVAQGETAALLTKMPLTRLSFQEFLRPLRRGSNAPSAMWDTATFLAAVQSLPHDRVDRAVLGADGLHSNGAWLEGFLEEALGPSYRKLLPEGLETELSEERWESLPLCAKEALTLASVCAEARGVLFLSAACVTQLPHDLLRKLPQTQDIRYLFLVSGQIILPPVADHYVVADETSIVGLGDDSWLQAQEDAIAPIIRRKQKDDSSFDDLDDDDDDD